MKSFARAVAWAQSASHRWTTWIGVFGGVLILVQVALTAADVTGRYVLSKPIHGAVEVEEILLAYVALAPLAMTLERGGHVRFTLITDRLGRTPRILLEILSACLGIVLFAFFFIGGIDILRSSWAVNEVMVPGLPIPYWIAKGLLPIGAGLMLIQLIISVLHQCVLLISGDDDARHPPVAGSAEADFVIAALRAKRPGPVVEP